MTDRFVLITGASTGIGRALADWFAAHGYSLGLFARRLDLLNQLATGLQSQYPTIKIKTASLDITNLDACAPTIQRIVTDLGGLDIFVANAGIGYRTPEWKPVWKEIRPILETNILGAVASIEAAKDILLAQKRGGQIVGISSVAAFRGLPASSAYCTSKAALTTYLESLRVDLRPHDITVTSIHPGYIKTPMTAKNKGPMPFLLELDDAAQRIAHAIIQHRARYVFPFPLKISSWLLKHIPNILYDYLIGLRHKEGVFR